MEILCDGDQSHSYLQISSTRWLYIHTFLLILQVILPTTCLMFFFVMPRILILVAFLSVLHGLGNP